MTPEQMAAQLEQITPDVERFDRLATVAARNGQTELAIAARDRAAVLDHRAERLRARYRLAMLSRAMDHVDASDAHPELILTPLPEDWDETILKR